MYRAGHLGTALLVFAPIGYLLIARNMVTLAFVTGAVMLWLAMLPDVDHRIPLLPHRGPTHSLLFAALVGGAFAAAGWLLASAGGTVDPRWLAAVGFAIGFVAVFAHLVGDMLTPAGVNLLWPLSERTYSVNLTRADNTLANYGLFVLGVFVASGTMALALGLV